MNINKIILDKNNLPDGAEYNGVLYGVGHPKLHNVYKYHWDNRKQQGNWSFIMLREINTGCPLCRN